jgi:dTDP-4-dehydrorhamnose reductase
MKKVIIFGITGTIGKALGKTLNDHYEVYGTFNHPREESERLIQLPIENVVLLNEFLTKVNPDFVIMALRGDFQEQLRFHIQVAEYLKTNGGRMIFCSTANVFDGSYDSPHFENDEPKADSDYGQYKIECERVLAEILGEKLAIIRIPTILGHGTPRINELLQQINDQETIQVYTNLFSTRNTDDMLAKQIEYMMEHELKGIFHLATSDSMNHAEFIKKVVSLWGFTNVKFEESKIETFSAIIPDRYDNSLLSNKILPGNLRLSHEQLIKLLTSKNS